MDFDELTVGIEEEYQIIEPRTRELTSYVSRFLEQGATLFRDQVGPELLQSQIETGSYICRSMKEARREVTRLRNLVGEIADKNNCKIVAAGTHPFSRWRDQVITDKERYQAMVEDTQHLARRSLVFGMHVHVCIPDQSLRIDVMNQMVYFMPFILALSASSPFWQGQDTGLKSYRSVVIEDLPRTGLPEHFSSASEYDRFVELLIKTRSIKDPSKIWWDIRPHPRFPTLEIRICDCTSRISDVMAIVALIRSVAAKLIRLRESNQSWRNYRRGLIVENKWRAIRHGIEGEQLDLGKERAVPVAQLADELIELLDEVLDELGTREEVESIRTILKGGSSADRQLQKYEETGSLEAVVDMLAEETLMSL